MVTAENFTQKQIKIDDNVKMCVVRTRGTNELRGFTLSIREKQRGFTRE
jgi:hypothetical protein